MSEDHFGPMISRWQLVTAWLDDIKAWLPEYLAAYERQHGIPVGRTTRPRTFVVRHAGELKSGEIVPALVVWPSGVTDRQIDPHGTITGTMQLGLTVVAGANSVASTGDVLHRLTAAVMAMLDDRTTVAGHAQNLLLIDEDYEGLDGDRERLLQQATLSYEAYGVALGQRHAGPPPGSDPRPNPRPPWPPDPISEHVVEHVRLIPRDPNDIPD